MFSLKTLLNWRNYLSWNQGDEKEAHGIQGRRECSRPREQTVEVWDRNVRGCVGMTEGRQLVWQGHSERGAVWRTMLERWARGCVVQVQSCWLGKNIGFHFPAGEWWWASVYPDSWVYVAWPVNEQGDWHEGCHKGWGHKWSHEGGAQVIFEDLADGLNEPRGKSGMTSRFWLKQQNGCRCWLQDRGRLEVTLHFCVLSTKEVTYT